MNNPKINIADLFELDTAVIYNPDCYKPVSRISIDSRSITGNSIFVAIVGEKFNGHKFINEAVKKGASCVVINSKELKKFDKINTTIVTVKDTTKAYGQLANVWRNKLNAFVISLTGSNGKTTTKDMIHTLLNERYRTNKSEANNNNHIGVPLTILDTKSSAEVVVLEHGTNHFNEIEYTSKIAQPDLALITNIGDSHLEFLINRNGVHREKLSLFSHTEKNNGLILINNDDPYLSKDKKKFSRVISYGFKGSPDIKGKIEGYTGDGKTILSVKYMNKNINTALPVLGISNAKNYLAACSAALVMKMSKKEILSGTKKIKPAEGRLEYVDNNVNMLINDTYNSNPDSMIAAIELMKVIKNYKRKIVIAGDMFELGSRSAALHKSVAPFFKGITNLEVYTLGKMMKHMHMNLPKKGISSHHFTRRDSLKKFLQKLDISDSVILVKGSRGMNMEEFVEVIKMRG